MRILLLALTLTFGLALPSLGGGSRAVAQTVAQRGQPVGEPQRVVAARGQEQLRYQPELMRRSRGQEVQVPELDPGAGVQALALLLGVSLLMLDRKKRGAHA